MDITFYKYQATGNDFIIIDNRTKTFTKNNSEIIEKLCHRNFGIGADGFILLENSKSSDFKMIYFNSDGKQSTMCGNGGRCIVAFAYKLGLFKKETKFIAIDGIHKALIENNIISLQMNDVKKVSVYNDYIFTDTGSPHHVQLVENIVDFPVFSQGKKIRNELYGKKGSNINFVQKIDNSTFKIRTYERGVENETLACGTGATAVAIAMHKINKTKKNSLNLLVEGGKLQVSFDVKDYQYKNILLKGTATFVFKGIITI